MLEKSVADKMQRDYVSGLNLLDRRSFLGHAGTGLSSVALAQLLNDDRLLAKDKSDKLKITIDPARPYAPRKPHFPAKVKNVLVLFCAGAVSHIDSWDYKPVLEKYDGKSLPNAPKVTFQGPSGNAAKAQYKFRPRGKSGKMVSDLFPRLACTRSQARRIRTDRLRTFFPPALCPMAFPASALGSLTR